MSPGSIYPSTGIPRRHEKSSYLAKHPSWRFQFSADFITGTVEQPERFPLKTFRNP